MAYRCDGLHTAAYSKWQVNTKLSEHRESYMLRFSSCLYVVVFSMGKLNAPNHPLESPSETAYLRSGNLIQTR